MNTLYYWHNAVTYLLTPLTVVPGCAGLTTLLQIKAFDTHSALLRWIIVRLLALRAGFARVVVAVYASLAVVLRIVALFGAGFAVVLQVISDVFACIAGPIWIIVGLLALVAFCPSKACLAHAISGAVARALTIAGLCCRAILPVQNTRKQTNM